MVIKGVKRLDHLAFGLYPLAVLQKLSLPVISQSLNLAHHRSQSKSFHVPLASDIDLRARGERGLSAPLHLAATLCAVLH